MTMVSSGIIRPITPPPPPGPPHNTPDSSPRSFSTLSSDESDYTPSFMKVIPEPYCIVENLIHQINEMRRVQFEMTTEWVKAVKYYLEHRTHERK